MFRPCIDLHQGKVKQIVGGTLSDSSGKSDLKTNFTSEKPAGWYADLYKHDRLYGGHVIMLGPGNEQAAIEALAAFPGGLQVGGGINPENALNYLRAGASHVIVTSYLFSGRVLDREKLHQISSKVGRDNLVIDLSCRRKGSDYFVVTDRWQTYTDAVVREGLLSDLSQYCAEFLVHGVDVEGLCQGIELDLVRLLAAHSPIPATYAGGARSLDDLKLVYKEGHGKVGLTIGSALDIFGGNGVRYKDVLAFQKNL